MCQIFGNNRAFLPIYMVKIAIVLAIFLTAESAAGACLNYGHACWGAHGKRNGLNNDVSDAAKADWFYSKIISNPLDRRYYRDGDGSIGLKDIDDSYTDIDGKNIRSEKDWIRKMIRDNQLASFLNKEDNLDNLSKSQEYIDKRSAEEQ